MIKAEILLINSCCHETCQKTNSLLEAVLIESSSPHHLEAIQGEGETSWVEDV